MMPPVEPITIPAESEISQHLTGILKEYSCLICGFMCLAVFTSRKHYQRCPKCHTEHELTMLDVKVDIRIAKPFTEDDSTDETKLPR